MSVNASNLFSDLWPQLHATSAADFFFGTQNDLVRYLGDHIKRSAESFGLFVVRDTNSVTFSNGRQLYRAPALYLSGISFSYGGSPLIPSSTAEQDAGDSSFTSTVASANNPVLYWFADKIGANMLGFSPIPGPLDDGHQPELIYHEYPCSLHEDLGNSIINAPNFFGDYLELGVVKDAYMKTSDFEMPEVGKAAGQLMALYEQAMTQYWGTAQ